VYGTIPKTLLINKNRKVVYINKMKEYFFIVIESVKILIINKNVNKITV